MPHTMAAVTTVPKKPFGKQESIQRKGGDVLWVAQATLLL